LFANLNAGSALINSIAVSAMVNPGFVPSAAQCQQVDCCAYQLALNTAAIIGDSPYNPQQKAIDAINRCATQVQTNCQS
jgi:hypothetical protein